MARSLSQAQSLLRSFYGRTALPSHTLAQNYSELLSPYEQSSHTEALLVLITLLPSDLYLNKVCTASGAEWLLQLVDSGNLQYDHCMQLP